MQHDEDHSHSLAMDDFLNEIATEFEGVDWEQAAEDFQRHENARANLPDRIRGTLPDFGVYCLSVFEAARLVAADRHDARGLGPITSAEAKRAIHPEADRLVSVLVQEISCGTLKAETVRRTWDGKIDAARTFVSLWPLWDWLNDRCYTPGRLIQAYREAEMERREAVMMRAEALRLRSITPPLVLTEFAPLTPDEVEQCDRDELEAAYHALQLDFLSLSNEARDLLSTGGRKDVGGRSETTYLNIIGAMLALMLGKSPAGKPQSIYENQAAIIAALLGHHEGKPGISERTLEEKFAAAKRSLTAN